MGIDWQPFRLKPGISKTEFEKLILEQRQVFCEFERGRRIAQSCPILPLVEFGHADDLPEYADSLRLRPIAETSAFPKSWASELFTTCFVDETERLVRKRIDWIELLKTGRQPTSYELQFLRQGETFDSFTKNLNDPQLDEFFAWTKKWINRGYGMYLSF